MKRLPQPQTEEGDGVPEWVVTFDPVAWRDDTEQPPPAEVARWEGSARFNRHQTVEGAIGVRRWSRARHRWRDASQQWCAERNYSYSMVALGWARPATDEERRGETGTPPGTLPVTRIGRAGS